MVASATVAAAGVLDYGCGGEKKYGSLVFDVSMYLVVQNFLSFPLFKLLIELFPEYKKGPSLRLSRNYVNSSNIYYVVIL